ncbi:MAG: hypothetical protein GX795_04045 [Firmicutes bacterium]|nr:hypothetical protein [Bacillota bacterium]
MRKKFLVCSVLLLALCFSYPSFAGTVNQVEELAKKYVLAVESGDYEQGMQLATGAAVSWVEYMKASGAYRDGPVEVISCESTEFSGYWLVKVVFRDKDGDFGVRYVRVARSNESEFAVIDDGRRGRGWASDSFMPGIIFQEPVEIDGLRITVLSLLELPSEIKFDILIENELDCEVAIYPQLEAYYTVETTRVRRMHYYPMPIRDSDIDGPIAARTSKRGFLIFPKFMADFAGDPNLEGLRWVLYIPYGVDRQFAIER